jgi:hypothetical protein
MAILSIVMVMVVQFMSTTTMAQRKTKYNLQTQTESAEVMGEIKSVLQQANYVRVDSEDGKTYQVNKETSLDAEKRAGNVATVDLTTDYKSAINFDLVPDNYGNYIRKQTDDSGNPTDERKVILNLDTFKICTGKKADSAAYYPTSGDLDDSADVRSFRLLKQNGEYYYIKPEHIYVEYVAKDSSGKNILCNIIYRFVKNSDGGYSIYIKRSADDVDIGKYTKNRYATMKDEVDSMATDVADGRLSNHIQDFYLSADAEGNALVVDTVFAVKEYQYHVAETVNIRNSNVLCVRPQNTYKIQGTGGNTGNSIPDVE